MGNRYLVREDFLNDLLNIRGSVLEIGFNDPQFFRKYSHHTTIVGLENDSNSVHRSLMEIDKIGYSNRVIVCKGSIDNIPFQSDAFDAIVLSFVFCCLTDTPKALREIARVGKNNSVLYTFDHFNRKNPAGLFIEGISPAYKKLSRTGCNLSFDLLTIKQYSSLHLNIIKESNEAFLPWVYSNWKILK